MVMDEEEAAGPMPLIGTLQADGLAHVEAIRISLHVSWNADGKLGGASGAELDERAQVLNMVGGADSAGERDIQWVSITTCHNKCFYALTVHFRCTPGRTRCYLATAQVVLLLAMRVRCEMIDDG